jgi:ribosomal protein S18 acetylase RimI-like enzyme
LSALIPACRGKFEVLQLCVISVNERAQRLYRKHGFKEYGRAPKGFKRGDRYFDEVMMWRPVEPAGEG